MTARTALQPDDLLTLPPPPCGGHYELSEGELIAVSRAGDIHESVKAEIHHALAIYDPEHRIGYVYSESLFPLSGETARQPDVAFVLKEKRARYPKTHRMIAFAPDLAIEVISESESASDAERKVREYLAAGVQEVWQVYPDPRVIYVHTAAGVRVLRDDQTIESSVLPAFSYPVAKFFE